MADDNSTTPIGTTPITLDPETQRAIMYALEALSVALSRIEAALGHAGGLDSDLDTVDDMVFEGADRAVAVANRAREMIGRALFDEADPCSASDYGVPYQALQDLQWETTPQRLRRAVEDDDEQEAAA